MKTVSSVLSWTVFFSATDKQNPATLAFWNGEVKEECVMFRTKVSSERQVTDDGTQPPDLHPKRLALETSGDQSSQVPSDAADTNT